MQELECQRHQLSPAEYTEEQDALRAAAEQGSLDGGEFTMLQELGTFHSLLIWGHDELPQPTEDPYIKGVEEWMSFAQAVSPPQCTEGIEIRVSNDFLVALQSKLKTPRMIFFAQVVCNGLRRCASGCTSWLSAALGN